MNDYLCPVLLNETYSLLSKLNDLTVWGHHEKIPKALIDSCTIIGAFHFNKFRYSFSGKQNPNITAPLTHKEGSQQLFADNKSNYLVK